ncbi:hypothetical protein AVEN_222740-1 [Araneus ventricosus]|uniref:Uncharacterized protein n=1 Tax=Araneus ventricosus TaxID=182803 RepID=A0A4Y2B2J0_ARAVE|nr:hypothetical protein AVEN_222740-1 [Araneus ventricosus]
MKIQTGLNSNSSSVYTISHRIHTLTKDLAVFCCVLNKWSGLVMNVPLKRFDNNSPIVIGYSNRRWKFGTRRSKWSGTVSCECPSLNVPFLVWKFRDALIGSG